MVGPGVPGRKRGMTYSWQMPERVPAIKVLLLPKDTNNLGTIFGGVILSHIDLASAVEARKSGGPHRYVTKAMREVEFHEPVFLGDIVNFFTETIRIGRTSITVRVSVEAERWGTSVMQGAGGGPSTAVRAGHGERVKVTQAEVVLVAVNDQGRPVSIRPELPRA
jgi:acyl-CoA thioesterase YciA